MRIINIFAIVVLFLLTGCEIKAEVGDSVGYSIQVEGDNLFDGSLICKEESRFEMCKNNYSTSLAGVYNQEPALFLDNGVEGSVPLITSGKAWVEITNVNGKIEKGDFVTSSSEVGKAMKSTQPGIVLGVALEEGESGKIQVLVGIKTVNNNAGGANLSQTLKQGMIFPNLDALTSLRYWIAILICILSFSIGFIYYGKISKTGLEAMGRNPLAGKMIQVNIVLNIILITFIMVGGLALAYAIVVL